MSIKKQLIKLIAFLTVTGFLTAVLIGTIGQFNFDKTVAYKARFSDVTGLIKGDEVRIAGVRVGQVSDIQLVDRAVAEVTMEVSGPPVTSSSKMEIRYRNIVGQRYIALLEGPGGGTPLPAEGILPLTQTKPALDLTTLFNGFRPLFRALSPEQTNTLAFEIIKTLQGEGGTINALLKSTASLTSTLADRDAVIGNVITQLNAVLATINGRSGEFDDLVVTLQQFTTTLAADREVIFGSLANISGLADSTAGLLQAIRPDLRTDIDQLGKTAALLAIPDTQAVTPLAADDLNGILTRFPDKLNAITATATYGSWFNFYLCMADGFVTLPNGTKIPASTPPNSAARCQK